MLDNLIKCSCGKGDNNKKDSPVVIVRDRCSDCVENSPRIWFTSDTHFYDSRLELFNRPFNSVLENNNVLIDNWNSVVAVDDVVYHLGNFLYNADKNCDVNYKFLSISGKLNGRKILLKGNHDRSIDNISVCTYKGFVDVIDEGKNVTFTLKNKRDVNLNHYPSEGRKDKFNLVGHVHGAWRVQLNMLNVGVDVNNYFPMSEDKVISFIDAIEHYYYEDIWAAYKECNLSYLNMRGKQNSYLAKTKT